jgi:hypothetical protein
VTRPAPIPADRRRDGRARRLPPGAGCVVCGEARPELLHLHHPSTRELDPETVGARCLTHHREADLAREGAGCMARALPGDPVLRIVAAKRGRGAELVLLGKAELREADALERAWLGRRAEEDQP